MNLMILNAEIFKKIRK